jgi:hypothetical protein
MAMMMVVVAVVAMMMVAVVPRRSVVAGPRNPVAGLHPAKAIPDRAADGADILDKVGAGGLAKSRSTRQRLGSTCNKR